MNEADIQNALKRSVQTEKNAMNFYQIAASHMTDEGAIQTFELLAREEREHAQQFFAGYKGDDLPSFEAFIDAPPDNESDWLTELDKTLLADFSERKALELAMEKELNLEKNLREMAARIDQPEVRAVFEENARSTHNHYVIIESEYARLMGMVHETDIDTFVRE
ncbi:MAG TPA: ferritin family protein [Geopsychrobacteraceae bacterium]|jgi:rubrerythrin